MSNEKSMREGARGSSFPRPSPIVFPFELGSDFARHKQNKTKHTPTKKKRQLRGLISRMVWAVLVRCPFEDCMEEFPAFFNLITAC